VKALILGLVFVAFCAGLTFAQSVKLRWIQSESTPVSSNNIYRGDVSGGPYAEVFESTLPIAKYTDAAVIDGQTYCWVVTAVSNGIESTYSNEACETVTTRAPSNLTVK
jgi:hypothetical protein